MIIVHHDAHVSTSPFKTDDRVMMVFTPYPDEQIKEVLDYGDTTHFVSVVFNASHFAVLYYNIAKCTVTVFDGLNYSIKKVAGPYHPHNQDAWIPVARYMQIASFSHANKMIEHIDMLSMGVQ
jgi:hypothetical protein